MNIALALTAMILALIPAQLSPERFLTPLLAKQKVAQNATTVPDYQPVPAPVLSPGVAPISLTAASWYAVDTTTGSALAEHDATTKRPIASITKIATALVILRNHKESEVITIPKLPAYTPDDELVGLKTGEQYTTHDLLTALLVNSANDAADSLAITDSGSREAFADKMNALIAGWGISGAHFSNPSGLSDTNNGASAKALAQIAALALHNQTFKTLVRTPSAMITAKTGRSITLTSTDNLLQNGRFSGIKTGYTAAAGQCFVGLTSIHGRPVITVVLGSQDRFGDTTKLADWINASYTWQ